MCILIITVLIMTSAWVNNSPYVISSINPLTTPLYIGDTITCRIEGSPHTTKGVFGWGQQTYVWDWISWPPKSGDITITVSDYPNATMIMFSPSAFVYQWEISRWDYIRATRPPPIAKFSGSPRFVQAGSTDLGYVQFVDESIGSLITSWEWSLPGCFPTLSLSPNPYRKYVEIGTFPVTLTVRNSGGSNSLTKNPFVISTLQPPPLDYEAQFYGYPRSGDNPLTVQFFDGSTRTPSSWYWSFGDGYHSSEQYPLHVYTSVGIFTVSLSATWGTHVNNITKIAYIKIPRPIRPVPEFSPLWSLQIGPL
jgi:PKD repeat protein